MSSITAAVPTSAPRGIRVRTLSFGLALISSGLVLGMLAGDLVASGHALAVLGLVVVLLPVALWKRPQLGPVILVAAAVSVEQVGQNLSTPGSPPLTANIPITPQIPLFRGIGSLHLQAIDLVLLMVSVIYLARTDSGTRCWPRSHVSRAAAALFAAIVFGVVMGEAHHGSLRVALMECRPYVYLLSAYVLTAVLIRTHSALQWVLWAFVIATGIKAFQGVYVYIQVRSWALRPDSLLGHEVAYPFSVFILLVPILWLYDVRGRLRTVATWLLPVVFMADLLNHRRTAWLSLGGGIAALIIIGYCCLPDRRRAMRRVGLVVLAVSAVYFPIYWNKDGGFAQPARAIHSAFTPDPRDASSNLYRVQENANLKFNIKEGGVLGKGFGVPIDYALPIVDISKIDPFIKYVPHNGVLYIPMRLGLFGTIAFWSLLGTAIVAGCRIARGPDRRLAMIGALVVCSMVAYALDGMVDQGFYFDRIALLAGALLGLAEAARRLQRLAAPVAQAQPRMMV